MHWTDGDHAFDPGSGLSRRGGRCYREEEKRKQGYRNHRAINVHLPICGLLVPQQYASKAKSYNGKVRDLLPGGASSGKPGVAGAPPSKPWRIRNRASWTLGVHQYALITWFGIMARRVASLRGIV